jgi:Zinc finger, C3HC4 type (RING finger)
MSRLSMEPSDMTNAGRQSVSPIVLHHCRGSGDNGHSGRTILIRPAYDSSNLFSKNLSNAQPSPRKLSTSSTPRDTPLESLQLPPPLIPIPAGGSSAKEQRPRTKQPTSRRSHPHISPLHRAVDSNPEIPVACQNPPPVPSRKSIPTLRDRTVSQLPSPSSVMPEPVEKKSEVVEAVEGQSSECAVCLERAPDCVLYTCGHMCMCYKCAEDVVKNRGALCPICRQPIRDIIKIYRS